MTSYSYDPRGQLASVVNPFGERTTWVWDALGREQRQSLANGVVASTTYDAAGRPRGRVHRQSSGTPLSWYTASYDAVGNRTAVQELDGSFAYGYDASRQLTSERRTGSGGYSVTYTYAPDGS